MNTIKHNLINQLNIQKQNLSGFIYPDFPDFKIHSKEYYRNIFLNYFNNEDKFFSLMYADFNKLKKINNSFGNIAGDKALSIGHKFLKESFPDNTLISRVGGDETIIIIPNYNKEKTLEYNTLLAEKLNCLDESLKSISIKLDKISKNNNMSYFTVYISKIERMQILFGKEAFQNTLVKIQEILSATLPEKTIINKIDTYSFNIIIPKNISEKELEEYKKKTNEELAEFLAPLSISITSSVLDSSTDNIKELEKMTERHVSEQKNLRDLKEIDKNETDPWKILDSYINTAIENYLSNIRPSNKFIYDIDDYKKEVFFMIDTFINTLEHDISDEKKDTIDSFELEDDSYTEEDYISADSELTSSVHHFLTEDNFSVENLDEEKLTQMYEFMSSLMYKLTINKDSSLLNKSYLKQYLANQICESKSNYQSVFISMSGIKPSNTAYGHHTTDDRMIKTTKIIKKILCDRTFSNDLFTFSKDDSYLIDYGGGNFLLLLSNDQEINQEELDEKINKINSYYNPQDPNSSFKVAGSIQDVVDNSNKENFIKDIRELKEKCNNKKDPLKKDSFDDITQKTAFEKSIKKCINYYLKNIPNAKTDINIKKKFISMVFYKLAEQEGNYNIQSRKNIQDNNIEQ